MSEQVCAQSISSPADSPVSHFPWLESRKQKGKEDERYLWPEMLRVVRELAPRWVVGENVPGILRIAAADVISDLEREGYHAVVLDFEAAAVGAPHRRERIAFVAHRGSKRLQGWDGVGLQKCFSQRASWENDTYQNLGGRRRQSQPGTGGMADGLSDWLDRGVSAPGKWLKDPHPAIPRVEIGVKNRANRIKCLGNAVVPQQFYPIFAAIRNELDHAEAESVA